MAIQVNYPQTTFELSAVGGELSDLSPAGLSVKDAAAVATTYAQASLTSNAAIYDMTFNGALYFDSIAGDLGDVLTTDATGHATWQPPYVTPTPNLAEVLAVATAGDADSQPISNLLSLAFAPNNAAAPLELSSDLTGGTRLRINTPADTSLATKTFSRNYLPINVAGTVYYLQLFSPA